MADSTTASKRQSMSGANANSTNAASNNATNRLSMGVGVSGSGAGSARPGNASPNVPANQGPGELDAALSKAIGARVKLITSAPSSSNIEGTIFTACPITNIIAINTSVPASAAENSGATQLSSSTYRLIPVSRIQSFSIISLPATTSSVNGTGSGLNGFGTAQPSIARMDLKAIKAREDAAIRRIKEHDATRGKGVTKEAQDIFDAIARTLPARWHETSIIVNDSVMIRAPYRIEDCQADKSNQNALARVKKVLENVKRKISEKNATSAASVGAGAAAASAPAPRKGG